MATKVEARIKSDPKDAWVALKWEGRVVQLHIWMIVYLSVPRGEEGYS